MYKMKKLNIVTAALLAVCLNTSAQTVLSNKNKAVALLNSLQTKDSEGPSFISDERYKQHNLIIADNKPGFLALQKWLPADNKVNIIRAFEDGDYVFINAEYSLQGGMAGMDIFKFKDGKAIEHWDNLQIKPIATGNHTMTDGPITATDLDKTMANKKLVRQFVQEVFVKGNMDKLDYYIDGERFIEHHPGFADGLSGLKKGFADMQAQGTALKYTAIHQILGEGNFCMVQGEAVLAGKHIALYDLYRIENGKIAEHWDVVEEIPAKETWKNPNGKF
jgi:predicted SnoaL-like aldol condensation-catalyzing enzyme